MKKFTISLVVIMASTFIVTAQSLQSKMSVKYNDYLQNDNVTSMALVVKKGNKQFIKLGADVGIDKYNQDAVFNIGSATKTMTSVLVLQQVQKGVLALTDPIGDYLPPLNNVDPKLTIEQLLRQRSSLGELVGRNIIEIKNLQNDPMTKVDFLKEIPEPFEAGEFRYINTNYILLGHILENATQEKYYDLLEENIFKQCRMNNSFPFLHQGIENALQPMEEGKSIAENLNYKIYDTYAFSAGSVASTLDDMYKFYHTLYETENLLDKTHFDLLISSVDDEKEKVNYGLGIMTIKHTDHTFYGHNGDHIGYTFRNYFDVDNKNYVIVIGNELRYNMEYDIQRECLNYIKGKEFETIEWIDAEHLTSISGEYLAPETDFAFSLIEKNGLPYIDAIGNEQPLLYKSDTLYNVPMDLTIILNSETSNQVELNMNNSSNTAYKEGYIPTEFLLDKEDHSAYDLFVGKYIINKIGVELELKLKDDLMFFLVQGSELSLKEKESNKLIYAAMDMEFVFDPADNNQFIYRQSGQEFVAERLNDN